MRHGRLYSFYGFHRVEAVRRICLVHLQKHQRRFETEETLFILSGSLFSSLSCLRISFLGYSADTCLQIYIALLKFDFFFFLAFTVQFLVVVRNTADIEFYLTIAAIPITIIILLAAAWFTQKETLIGMILIIVSLLFIGVQRRSLIQRH